MTIKEWQKAVHEVAKDHGWWDRPNDIGRQITNMHGELSEAWEEFRGGRPLDYMYYSGGTKPEGFGVELADCVIRIMDTCEANGIDLEKMIELKNEYNKTREWRHGGKLA